jgi:hypothetical protein
MGAVEHRRVLRSAGWHCFTNGYWEEGGHEAGVYRAGDLIGALADTHGHGGYAVTADADAVYIAYKLDEHSAGVRAYSVQTRQPADVGRPGEPGYLGLSNSFTAIRAPARNVFIRYM